MFSFGTLTFSKTTRLKTVPKWITAKGPMIVCKMSHTFDAKDPHEVTLCTQHLISRCLKLINQTTKTHCLHTENSGKIFHGIAEVSCCGQTEQRMPVCKKHFSCNDELSALKYWLRMWCCYDVLVVKTIFLQNVSFLSADWEFSSYNVIEV